MYGSNLALALTILITPLLTMTTSAESSGAPKEVTWRLPDGTYTQPPSDAIVMEAGARVVPGAEGTPVFSVPFAVEANDVISVELNLEAILTEADEGADGQGGIVLTMLPKDSRHNYNPNAEHRQIAIVGSEAEFIRFAFRAQNDHESGELLLVPTLSYFGRTLELSDIVFTQHGPEADPAELTASTNSYRGQELDAAWREEADRRIDKYRRADLKVVVTNRLGDPIEGVDVSIEQLQHAYPFGTAIVSSRIVDAPRVFPPESNMTTELWLSDNKRYRKEILRNFNAIVTENDLKWPQWAYSNRSPGIYSQNWTLDALDWFHQHEMKIKGHTLVWGSWRFTPFWLRDLEDDPEAVQEAALAHIRDIGGATADRAYYWDVLNEPMSHRNLIELLGMEKVAEWFKVSREVLPNTRLVMNEFDIVGNGGSPQRRANFIAFYEELKKYDAPLDVIGFQGHFWSERFTAPEDVWEIIDEVHEATGLPVMISEFDSNIPNEQMQADYTRDFLTAWFAHPVTEAFIMWGFWGGAHWMGDAGAMFRRDWSEKPNLAAYRNLVYGDWWTSETLKTNDNGEVQTRATLGRHQIEVTHADGRITTRRIDLKPEGLTLYIILPEPELQ